MQTKVRSSSGEEDIGNSIQMNIIGHLLLDVLVMIEISGDVQRQWRSLKETLGDDAIIFLENRKDVLEGEANPVAKFNMGPFEKTEDQFYKSNKQYMNALFSRSFWLEKKIRDIQSRKGTREKNLVNPYGGFEGDDYSRGRIKQNGKERKAFEMVSYADNPSKMDKTRGKSVIIDEELDTLRQHLQVLQNWSLLLEKLSKKFEKFNGEVPFDRFHQTLKNLEDKNRYWHSMNTTEETYQEGISVTKSFNKGMNYSFPDNQYLVDGIVTINRLPEGSEKFYSKSNEKKIPGMEIYTELSDEKIKEILTFALERCNFSQILKNLMTEITNSSCSADEKLSKILQHNFFYRNITLKQIDEMSRIIEFVEKYRGDLLSKNEETGETTPTDLADLVKFLDTISEISSKKKGSVRDHTQIIKRPVPSMEGSDYIQSFKPRLKKEEEVEGYDEGEALVLKINEQRNDNTMYPNKMSQSVLKDVHKSTSEKFPGYSPSRIHVPVSFTEIKFKQVFQNESVDNKKKRTEEPWLIKLTN